MTPAPLANDRQIREGVGDFCFPSGAVNIHRKYKQMKDDFRLASSDSTRLFYESHSSDYARATVDLPLVPILSRFARRLSHGDRVVDLGCGAGRDLKAFRRCLLDPVGIDYSFSLCKIARHHSSVPVVTGDMRKLPFETGSFSAASAVASLLHLSRSDIAGTLAEISRVLRKEGLLFTSVKYGVGETKDRHGRWFTYFTTEEWRGYLECAGFSLLDAEKNDERRRGALLSEDITWISSTWVKS
jgi:SAM-dependent methyltransferase